MEEVFTTFVSVAVFNGVKLVFAFHTIDYVACMAQKGELFSFSVLSHPATFTNYIGPFIIWSFYYLLTCAAPMIAAALPTEFSPSILLIAHRLVLPRERRHDLRRVGRP